MKFKIDEEIEKLDLSNVDDVVQLIIVYLCGEKHDKQLSESDRRLLEDLLNHAKQKGLNYEQFNELLLLLNQVRVSNGFFKKFLATSGLLIKTLFKKTKRNLKNFLNLIVKSLMRF
jgi:hypothetical protein